MHCPEAAVANLRARQEPDTTSVLRRRHHDNAPPAHGLTRRSAGQIASGEDDNHFAGCASLTDMSKRGGNLVEREGAVDVDPDVPGNA